jgi:ribonuclease-3
LIDALPAERLSQVFMHPSRVDDRSLSYERLEFLGDSILGLLVARELFERYPDAAEGELSRLRSAVVSRRSCAAVAREIGLDRMFAEQFELTDDLRRSDNVLAALVEAAIAALVLEHGLDAVSGAVIGAFEGHIEEALHAPADFKTRLQEEAAKDGRKVTYNLVAVEGPAHDRQFTCEAIVGGVPRGIGTGRSKKDAQQAAAAEAIASLEDVGDLTPGVA